MSELNFETIENLLPKTTQNADGSLNVSAQALHDFAHAIAEYLNRRAPAPEQKIKIGQHWLEVAFERIEAGESELDVLKDYGYAREPIKKSAIFEDGKIKPLYIEVDGIQINEQWVRDIRGKLAETDFKLQKLESDRAQAEPVAKVGRDPHELEWLSQEAFDSVPIGAPLYIHPIPAAPAVLDKSLPAEVVEVLREKRLLMDAFSWADGILGDVGTEFANRITEDELMAATALMQFCKDMQKRFGKKLAASPEQQGGAE